MKSGISDRGLCILLACAFLSWIPSLTLAVTNTEVFANLPIDLRISSARGAAMGRTFISLANDPSTAFNNPAGLLQIDDQALLIEGRFLDRDFSLRSTGTEFSGDFFTFSTLAWTLPFGEKWRFGAYYYETFRDEREFALPPQSGLASIDASFDLSLGHIGAALAYQVSKDLQLGVSVNYSRLDIDYSLLRGGTDRWSADDSDESFSVTAGALWNVHPAFQVGFFVLIPPEFDFVSRLEAPGVQRNFSWDFNFPLTLGTGLRIKALDDVTVFFDLLWLDWGNLADTGVTEAFGDIDLDGNPPVADPVQAGSGATINGSYTLRDVFQYHIGAELRLKTKRPVALRGGFYHLNSTGIRFNQDVPSGAPSALLAQREFFSGSGNEEHITFGAGFGLSEHFSLDLAVDLESNQTEFLAGLQITF